MKAIVYEKYGPPEVMRMKEVEKPVPKDNEVLVKVRATTLNRTDCGFRKPEYPVIIRLINGLFRPKIKILGSEFAGDIESAGNNVREFKTGDRVFGLSAKRFGTHAEYVCIPEDGSMALMPANVSYEDAAAVCDGLMLALTYIRKINFTGSTDILINGASGSIGTAGLQLAKINGATVTAVCDTRNMDLVKSLGADRVIDYLKENFTRDPKIYDVVFDAVGKSSFYKCRKLLKPRGIYFSTELGFLAQNIFLALITPVFRGRKVKFPVPKDSREDILYFRGLLESGKYKAVIDRRYPLEQIVEAAKYVETGQKSGNVVITVQ